MIQEKMKKMVSHIDKNENQKAFLDVCLELLHVWRTAQKVQWGQRRQLHASMDYKILFTEGINSSIVSNESSDDCRIKLFLYFSPLLTQQIPI